MKVRILHNKLIAFMNANKDKVTRKPKHLCFEMIRRESIGRCCTCRDTRNGKIVGFDIIISIFHLTKHPDNLEAYKQILLHEMAHCNLRSRGHDLTFKKTARRIGCDRNFRGSFVYIGSGE